MRKASSKTAKTINWWWCFGIAGILLLIDILSKGVTHLFLPLMTSKTLWYPYGGIGVFENFLGIEFSISHATNTGAAWGMFSQFPQGLLFFRIFLLVGILSYALFINRTPSWRLPLTLIITGAAANILDSFIYGHVVDMFHFVLWGYDYPVFNVADTAIFIGIFWLGILHFSKGQKQWNQQKT